MAKRKKEEPQPSSHACAIEGCALPGEFKAPRSRDALHEYQWLCLDHIRAFNLAWDYFKGMSPEEIENFRHDALTGHRPTWQREDHIKKKTRAALDEGLKRFFQWDEESLRTAERSRLPSRERRALEILELEEHCSIVQLKKHFRTLVKRTHPDLHRGDKEAEEKFKEINNAYRYLLKLYENEI